MNWTSDGDYQDIRYELSGDGIAKIALLNLFSTTFPLYGIFASWTLPMILLILGINLLMFLKLPDGFDAERWTTG